jgi:hypothetical protein
VLTLIGHYFQNTTTTQSILSDTTPGVKLANEYPVYHIVIRYIAQTLIGQYFENNDQSELTPNNV